MRRFAPMIFTLLFIALFGWHTTVFAQNVKKVEDADISAQVTPETPGASTQVTVTLQSYVTDLDRAYMSWQKNGKQQIYGYGKKQLSFTSGALGETTTITVSIKTVTGEIVNKRIVVNPAEVELLWEGADSYTPPFYRGRALPGPEGLVRVVALPQIHQGDSILDSSDYIFTWKRQDQILESASGFGKNAFVFQKDYLNPNETIDVLAQNNSTGSLARATLSVQAFQPQILFYEKNPLLGIQFQNALADGFKVQFSDKTIVAIPYFISPKNPTAQELSYEWSINGASIPVPATKNVLTIRRGTQSGTALIKLHITNIRKLFLDVSTQIQASLQ